MVIKLPWKPGLRRNVSRFGVRWIALRLLAGVFFAAVGGCVVSPSGASSGVLPAPLLPTPLSADSKHFSTIMDWLDCPAPSDAKDIKSPLADLVLTYHNTGRDFREPVGPDGYLLRVIPLDKAYHAIRVRADMEIGLFTNPPQRDGDGGLKPLKVWYIPADQLAGYWQPNVLIDGYLFRLDWSSPIPEQGKYILIVKMTVLKKNEMLTVCQRIAFEDVENRQPTSESPPPASAEKHD